MSDEPKTGTIRASIAIEDSQGVLDTLDLRTWGQDTVRIRAKNLDIVVNADELLRAVKAVTTK